MKKLWDRLGTKGQAQAFLIMITAVFAGVLAITIVSLMSVTPSISASIDRLESDGSHVVLTIDQYNTMMALLSDIDTKADAAVVAAQAAVVTAQTAADKVDLFNSAQRYVFPETTVATCTLTAGGTANTFGAWAEITDNATTTLSASFAANAGYLNELTPFLYSAANKSHLIEISYGATYINIARLRWYARADSLIVLPVYSAKIPAGETVYYRMMCETGGATCRVGLRYFYE